MIKIKTLFILFMGLLIAFFIFNKETILNPQKKNNDDFYIKTKTMMDRVLDKLLPGNKKNGEIVFDKGNIVFNSFLVGNYVMYEESFFRRELMLINDNTAVLIYRLPESGDLVYEDGFWKTDGEGLLTLKITGNQFGKYEEPRDFIFDIKEKYQKLVSDNYEKIFYGSGGLVFYKK